jgi:hypothetical protein
MSDGTQLPATGPPLNTTATPTNCPPAIAISVTQTRIEGAFNWGITAAVTPAAQDIPLDGKGTARCTVVAAQETANEFTSVQYVVEGSITIANHDNAVMPHPTVIAVSGNDRATAICNSSSDGISPGSAATYTFQLALKEPSSGSVNAEVTMPGSASPARVGRAQFDFTHAVRISADNASACALVSMTFQANYGMLLQKQQDLATPLHVDGSAVRICNATRFEFDLQYSPKSPLQFGNVSQPVYQQVGLAAFVGEAYMKTVKPDLR